MLSFLPVAGLLALLPAAVLGDSSDPRYCAPETAKDYTDFFVQQMDKVYAVQFTWLENFAKTHNENFTWITAEHITCTGENEVCYNYKGDAWCYDLATKITRDHFGFSVDLSDVPDRFGRFWIHGVNNYGDLYNPEDADIFYAHMYDEAAAAAAFSSISKIHTHNHVSARTRTFDLETDGPQMTTVTVKGKVVTTVASPLIVPIVPKSTKMSGIATNSAVPTAGWNGTGTPPAKTSVPVQGVSEAGALIGAGSYVMAAAVAVGLGAVGLL